MKRHAVCTGARVKSRVVANCCALCNGSSSLYTSKNEQQQWKHSIQFPVSQARHANGNRSETSAKVVWIFFSGFAWRLKAYAKWAAPHDLRNFRLHRKEEKNVHETCVFIFLVCFAHFSLLHDHRHRCRRRHRRGKGNGFNIQTHSQLRYSNELLLYDRMIVAFA